MEAGEVCFSILDSILSPPRSLSLFQVLSPRAELIFFHLSFTAFSICIYVLALLCLARICPLLLLFSDGGRIPGNIFNAIGKQYQLLFTPKYRRPTIGTTTTLALDRIGRCLQYHVLHVLFQKCETHIFLPGTPSSFEKMLKLNQFEIDGVIVVYMLETIKRDKDFRKKWSLKKKKSVAIDGLASRSYWISLRFFLIGILPYQWWLCY